MKDIIVVINSGTAIKTSSNKSYYDILKENNLLDNVIGITVNNKIVSLYDNAENSCNIKTLDIKSNHGNKIYVAGLKMLFEYSVKKYYKGINVDYLYSIPKGIVVKLDINKEIEKSDVSNIKKIMNETIENNLKFEKLTVKTADALLFYKNLCNKQKEENILNINDNFVIFYRLGNLVNYYYSEMPYSTNIITDYDIKLLSGNRLVITYPMDGNDKEIPDYKKYKTVIDSYEKGISWLNVMRIPYICDLNKLIYNGKIKDFIRSSELNFNRDISDIAEYVASNKNIKCIMLSGPSASGKTTVIKRLASYLGIYGLDPIIISLDGYYKERVDTPKDENGEYDYECLEALDLDYLNDDITKLFNGEEINLPEFNFITGRKEKTNKIVKISENSIVLFEGLHAINDDLLPMIPANIKYKIFVSPFIPIAVDEHNYISSDDLRLIRRILRDFTTRGYGVETTLKNNVKVHLGEEKYILPIAGQANVVLNTSLSYEIGVLKVLIEPLLYAVKQDSEYYNDARRLLGFLKQFFPISPEFVARDSLLREFIGGFND